MPPNSGYRPSSEPRSTPPIGISASASSGEIRARSRRWYDPLRRVWASRPRPEQVSLQHHIGGAYNATNNNHGPVTTIQHASNLTMVSQGASDDWLLLEGLPRHPDISAEWRDLVPHSRDTDLGRIWQYIDSPVDKDLILWIYGPPGIGKSALARQLKDDIRSRNRLAASIFLSRLFIDLLGPETLIRLIGGEIGRTYRQAVSVVAEAVRLCHGTSLSFHVEKFIRDPLLSLQLPHPLIIIIDGVTEWTSHTHFIEQLSQLAPYTSLVRFIILGRSEPPRDARYKSIPIRSFKLAPVSVELIAGCLSDRFDTIEWKDGRRPTEEDVLRLAAMADGQFTRIEGLVSLVRELPPSNYDDISEPISRLATSYRNSFKKSGSVDEIDRAILLGRVALALRPSDHPERHSSFHNLATSLSERYNKSNSTEDLEERILLHREALALRPPGHPYRHYSFHNLAKSLHDRFLKGGVIGDLEEAITLGREELRLRPEGHTNRCSTLLSQRIYLHDLFKMRGAVENLQEAITLGEEALAICPKGHSHYATLPAAISSYKAKLAQLPTPSGVNSSQSNQT